MEAKETVIKEKDIKDLWIPCENCHREPFWKSQDGAPECMECIALKHREAQAEISFKAGERNILDILRTINVRAWEDVLIYIGGGKPS